MYGSEIVLFPTEQPLSNAQMHKSANDRCREVASLLVSAGVFVVPGVPLQRGIMAICSVAAPLATAYHSLPACRNYPGILHTAHLHIAYLQAKGVLGYPQKPIAGIGERHLQAAGLLLRRAQAGLQ